MKIIKTETEVTSTTTVREINITFTHEEKEYTAAFNRTSVYESNTGHTEHETTIVNQLEMPALPDEEDKVLWAIADQYTAFDNHPDGLLKIIAGIDWSLLRSQKLKFCEILAENDLPKPQADAIDGILSLIDVISDATVSDGLESEETVFKSDLAGEPAELIHGNFYNVTTILPGDAFKDMFLLGGLRNLIYDCSNNLDYFFVNKETDNRIGLLVGAEYEPVTPINIAKESKNPNHDQETI